MPGSVNKVILVGNLGRDPETRHTQSGSAICNLNVATSESWKDRNTGERKERTEWHRVVIFNEHLAKFAESNLRKGAKVYLEGQLQTRKWTDQAGVEKFTTEIVLQNFKGELVVLEWADSPEEKPEALPKRSPAPAQQGPQRTSGLDDEIPF